MDLALILVAFIFGFAANTIKLPPLVGYLAAGFVLHACGYHATDAVDLIADFGVLLLLFGIGLKLQLTTLGRPAVWAGASIHAATTTAFIGGLLLGLGALGPAARSRALATAGGRGRICLLVLKHRVCSEGARGTQRGHVIAGQTRGRHSGCSGHLRCCLSDSDSGDATIDLGDSRRPRGPRRQAGVWLALNRAGHGELFLLFGLTLAIAVGAESFAEVGLKPDLGALLIGLTLANHSRASELANTLLGCKDILLIGFFLSIGLEGTPGLAEIGVALVVLLVLPLKAAGFVWLTSRFRFRVRTAWHTSVTLATYSEFGLIVAVVSVNRDMIAPEWTSAIGVAVALSFALAAPLNTARYAVFTRLFNQLARLERTPVQPDDELLDPLGAEIMVFGMGRVGVGAFDELATRRADMVLGVDRNERIVRANLAEGRQTIRGDALDIEFWERLQLDERIDLVVLAMNDHTANVEAVRRVKDYLPSARIAAIASHPDDVRELEVAGVDVARNLYDEAGQGLADDAYDLLYRKGQPYT